VTTASELPDRIENHLSRDIATDGVDGYLWDACAGGGKGMVTMISSNVNDIAQFV